MDTTQRPEQKPATAARIYDYYIGGTHNFPADRAAAQEAIKYVPQIPASARANRAFLRRAVRFAAESGIRQFLDIGSGIPTEGNVHEIAQDVAEDAHVVYVDIDPVAVAEGLEILETNDYATSIRGNLRDPEAILGHPEVARLIDFSRPVAILLCAVLHFVAEDDAAYGAVAKLRSAAGPGSYLILSHATPNTTVPEAAKAEEADKEVVVGQVYTQQTMTPFRMRQRDEVARFFGDFELVDPGLTWVSEWRRDPDEPNVFADDPAAVGIVAAVGILP
jgi:S-adenosyl methyltransferase